MLNGRQKPSLALYPKGRAFFRLPRFHSFPEQGISEAITDLALGLIGQFETGDATHPMC